MGRADCRVYLKRTAPECLGRFERDGCVERVRMLLPCPPSWQCHMWPRHDRASAHTRGGGSASIYGARTASHRRQKERPPPPTAAQRFANSCQDAARRFFLQVQRPLGPPSMPGGRAGGSSGPSLGPGIYFHLHPAALPARYPFAKPQAQQHSTVRTAPYHHIELLDHTGLRPYESSVEATDAADNRE